MSKLRRKCCQCGKVKTAKYRGDPLIRIPVRVLGMGMVTPISVQMNVH